MDQSSLPYSWKIGVWLEGRGVPILTSIGHKFLNIEAAPDTFGLNLGTMCYDILKIYFQVHDDSN